MRERTHASRVVAIVVDRAAGGRRDLHEREAPDPARLELEQAGHGVQPLDDSLRVVEAVDADAEPVLARQSEPLADRAPRVGDALRRGERRRRPFDRDRVAVHRGRLAAEGDRERFAVDARFQLPVDRVEEIVAVKLRVETEDAAAEQAVEQLDAPRADRERLRVGPGNVPERDDGGVRQALADHPRQQREMVVLHQHHRVLRLGFGDDRVREPRVDVAVVLEIARAERGAHVRDVTQRPQALVGEAVVIPALFLGREPDAPDLVERLPGRHRHAVVAIDGLAVGAAAAVRDPGPRARAHHGLERGDEAAGRVLDADSLRRAHVDIRLPVGHRDHVVAVQLAAQRRPQRLLVPDALAAVERPVLPLEVADQVAEVAGDRAQLRRRGGTGRPQDALAAQQPAQAVHPAPPRELRDDDRDQRDARAERDEEVEQVAARFLAAALDEAHVVDQHEARVGRDAAVDGANRDVQHAARRAQQMLAGIRVGIERGAPDLGRKLAVSQSASC